MESKLLPSALQRLQSNLVLYVNVLSALSRSEHDALFDARAQIATLMVEQEKHEQDVISWSKILQNLDGWKTDHRHEISSSTTTDTVLQNVVNQSIHGGGGSNAKDWSAHIDETFDFEEGTRKEENKGHQSVPGILPPTITVHLNEKLKQVDAVEETLHTTRVFEQTKGSHGGHGEEEESRTKLEEENAFLLWTQQEESRYQHAEREAKEEERILYQRQVEAKEQLRREREKRRKSQEEEKEELLLGRRSATTTTNNKSKNNNTTTLNATNMGNIEVNQTLSVLIPNSISSSSSSSSSPASQSSDKKILSDAPTFIVDIIKTAKRAEEGLGMSWGQRMKQEDIDMYSNILGRMYVVFVRNVLRNGNACNTGVKKKCVLVSIDGEDLCGRTIDYVHKTLDRIDIGQTVELEFFERGTTMDKSVYAPRFEAQENVEKILSKNFIKKFNVEEVEEWMEEEGGQKAGEKKQIHMHAESGRTPMSPEYSQLRDNGTQAVTPEFSQFQTSSSRARTTRASASSSSSPPPPPPPPPSSKNQNKVLLNEFHARLEEQLNVEQQQEGGRQKKQRNYPAAGDVGSYGVTSSTGSGGNGNRTKAKKSTRKPKKKQSQQHAAMLSPPPPPPPVKPLPPKGEEGEGGRDNVEPYRRQILTWENVRLGQAGGWLMVCPSEMLFI